MIEVSQREDGRYVIVDGQHRVRAVLDKWGPRTRVWCKIHRDLYITQEARLFYVLNQRRNLQAYDSFRALYVAGDEFTVDIVKVPADHGLKISNGTHRAGVGAVAAVRKSAKFGMQTLGDALSVLELAWGMDACTWDGYLIEGMSSFVDHYPGADLYMLAKRLKAYRGGATAFLWNAKGVHDMLKKTTVRAVAWQLADTHNRGRGGGS